MLYFFLWYAPVVRCVRCVSSWGTVQPSGHHNESKHREGNRLAGDTQTPEITKPELLPEPKRFKTCATAPPRWPIATSWAWWSPGNPGAGLVGLGSTSQTGLWVKSAQNKTSVYCLYLFVHVNTSNTTEKRDRPIHSASVYLSGLTQFSTKS